MKAQGQARCKIVDRALHLARRVGLEELSLGALAADMKRSKSGLFAHFHSKEELQLAVLGEAIERFKRLVIQPAYTRPPGELRLRAIFELYLAWIRGQGRQGGCILLALSHEYDDRPGAVRELLVEAWRRLRERIAQVAREAMGEKYLREDVDVEQFAFETLAIIMAFQQEWRLLKDPQANQRANAAFDGLLARSTPNTPNA
jgi:AcrR family transcriptional regulator